MKQILKSYFYWTYPRGCFHYDVMVTLILLFIFITPHLWNYGDRPSNAAGPPHPIQVIGDGGRGLIITVPAADVDLDLRTTESNMVVKKALHKSGRELRVFRIGRTLPQTGAPRLCAVVMPVAQTCPSALRVV